MVERRPRRSKPCTALAIYMAFFGTIYLIQMAHLLNVHNSSYSVASVEDLPSWEQEATIETDSNTPSHVSNVHNSSYSVAPVGDHHSEQEPTLKDSNKPSLIVHIGPSKTGTTTIQQDSVAFQEWLKLDNYVYLGRFAKRAIREPAKIAHLFKEDECLEQVKHKLVDDSNISNVPCWESRISGLLPYYEQNTSIILSDEAYSYPTRRYYNSSHFAAIRAGLGQWDLRVVATYRRYAEWAVSVAKEKNNKECHDPKKGQWPRQGGEPCQRIFDQVDELKQRIDASAPGYANLDRTVRSWASAGIPVQILNFHQDRPLTTSFYCDQMDTPHTCNYTRHREQEVIHHALSLKTTYWDDIVYSASLQNLTVDLEKDYTRQEVVQQVDDMASRIGLDISQLPLTCPDRHWLKKLLRKSMEFERKTLPAYHAESRSEHRRSFWSLVEQKAFCYIDMDRLLKNITSWSQLLEQLTRLASENATHLT